MLLRDAEDLSKFVEELQRETDRGLPLVCAALIDSKLEDTLLAFFCEGRSGRRLVTEGDSPLGTFSSRIEACSCLGLINQFEYSEAHLIRKIRNEFAHAKHGVSFKTQRILGLCSSLKTPLPDDADYSIVDPRMRFTNSAVAMVLRLYYRPEYVARERRQPKEWAELDFTRWRNFEDEPPPEGESFIAIGKPRQKP